MIAPAIRSHSGDPDERDETRDDDVEDALRRPGEPGEQRWAELEERQPLPRHVLALVDEELGCGRRELHLDAVAVGELHDAEDRLLVEVGLGEDELVWSLRLEHGGETLERLRPPDVGDGVDDVDPDPAAGGAELPLEVGERLALADQHQPAAHAEDAHELERDRAVRRPQEPDRERRRHDRRRYQPRRREVVVRPDAEREHDQRDEHERPEHPAGSRPPLARRVQPRLEEHENGDRRQERQPLGGPRLPEERPVDRVAVDDRSEDERDVDAEGEAGDVGEDQRPDAQRPPEEPDDGPAGEDVDARATDVVRAGRARRAGGRA